MEELFLAFLDPMEHGDLDSSAPKRLCPSRMVFNPLFFDAFAGSLEHQVRFFLTLCQ
jgi:hypothetical protein